MIFRYQYETISIYIINPSKMCVRKKRRNISPSNSNCIWMFVWCMKTLMRIDPSSTQAAPPNKAGEKPDWTRSPCGQNGDRTMPESLLLESLCLVTPSSGSERQQVSKHMWEEDTKQREERLQDCSEWLTESLSRFDDVVQGHDVEEVWVCNRLNAEKRRRMDIQWQEIDPHIVEYSSKGLVQLLYNHLFIYFGASSPIIVKTG